MPPDFKYGIALATLLGLFQSTGVFAEAHDFQEECRQTATKPSLCGEKSVQAFYVAARVVGGITGGCGASPNNADHSCVIDSKEENLLTRISSKLKSNQEELHLDFKSEKENPGFFFLDDQVRVAKTGQAPKDIIYVNTDIILAGDVDVGEAIAILVHELGHHHNIRDHQQLDKLGAKVKAFAEKYKTSSTLQTTWGSDIEITQFNIGPFWHRMPTLDNNHSNGRLVIWDGKRYIDLSVGLWPLLCTDAKYNRIIAFGSPLILTDEQPKHQILIRSAGSYICMPGFGVGQNHFDKNFFGTLSFESKDGVWRLSTASTVWDIKSCQGNTDLPCF